MKGSRLDKPVSINSSPGNLHQVGVKDGAASHVGDAVAGEDVDAPAAGVETMPPDAFDDDDARPRPLRQLRREARRAPLTGHDDRIAVADPARGGVGGRSEEHTSELQSR